MVPKLSRKKRTSLGLSLGLSRSPSYKFPPTDPNRFYHFVDSPGNFRPSSPLSERQSIPRELEDELKYSCKLLWIGVERGNPVPGSQNEKRGGPEKEEEDEDGMTERDDNYDENNVDVAVATENSDVAQDHTTADENKVEERDDTAAEDPATTQNKCAESTTTERNNTTTTAEKSDTTHDEFPETSIENVHAQTDNNNKPVGDELHTPSETEKHDSGVDIEFNVDQSDPSQKQSKGDRPQDNASVSELSGGRTSDGIDIMRFIQFNSPKALEIDHDASHSQSTEPTLDATVESSTNANIPHRPSMDGDDNVSQNDGVEPDDTSTLPPRPVSSLSRPLAPSRSLRKRRSRDMLTTATEETQEMDPNTDQRRRSHGNRNDAATIDADGTTRIMSPEEQLERQTNLQRTVTEKMSVGPTEPQSSRRRMSEDPVQRKVSSTETDVSSGDTATPSDLVSPSRGYKPNRTDSTTGGEKISSSPPDHLEVASTTDDSNDHHVSTTSGPLGQADGGGRHKRRSSLLSKLSSLGHGRRKRHSSSSESIIGRRTFAT